MAITAATISGGFTDPYLSGLEPAGTSLNAVNEYSDFVDKITVDLVNNFAPYISLDNLTATVSINSIPISFNELTDSGSTTLNLTYSSPNTTSVSGLTVVTTIESSNTVGNIYITGNIQNAFPDKYWEYKNFITEQSIVVVSPDNIPDDNVGLHTYKSSFMRFINLEFNVEAEYNSATESLTVLKRVINDWDINRLALISQVNREENYRFNNYPEVY